MFNYLPTPPQKSVTLRSSKDWWYVFCVCVCACVCVCEDLGMHAENNK